MSALDQAFIRAYSPGSTAEATADDPDGEADGRDSGFRPLLQVDGCVWPTVLTRMDAAAGEALDRIVDRVIVGMARGRKVVGFQGCRRGDGCTTLLLATGRRLARRGLRVLLVDADAEHPRLARRLGLAPQLGWEAVLDGRMPLEEVAIESLEDGLGILPLCEPTVGPDEESPGEARDGQDVLQTLREGYDLVLIDLGRPTPSAQGTAGLAERLRSSVDAVLLVQNVRGTSSLELNESCDRLRAAGMAHVAVLENFVQAGDAGN
jgi:Mrp family chromosome partitioning ATPase